MEAFNELRLAAKQKRDKAIADIREAYSKTLAAIARVEHDLCGPDKTGFKTIAECINSVMPTNGPFTSVDILLSLEALNSRRVWRKKSVDNRIQRLLRRGIVRRISKHKGTLEPAVYIREGVAREQHPFEDMKLADVAAKVLEGHSMNFAELAIAMLEQGYKTKMPLKGLRHALGMSLKKNRGRFVESGRRWTLAQ